MDEKNKFDCFDVPVSVAYPFLYAIILFGKSFFDIS